jgi:hypothetical protein
MLSIVRRIVPIGGGLAFFSSIYKLEKEGIMFFIYFNILECWKMFKENVLVFFYQFIYQVKLKWYIY